MSEIERNKAEFEAFLTGLAHGCVDFDQLAGWYFDQKAELAAKDATIERLREALDMIRVQATPEIAPGWVGIPETEWSGVLMLLDHDGLLTSLPPSDMRLVPVERLREWWDGLDSVDRTMFGDTAGAHMILGEVMDDLHQLLSATFRDAENRV